MSITQFTDGVEIQGSQDVKQLKVQGHSSQTAPLQSWEDSSATELSQITADGRLLVGDDLGSGTPDALIETHRDSASSRPPRALHALGRAAGVLSDALQWVVHELELVGSGVISGLHSTLRLRLRHESTGDATDAQLLAADVEVSNTGGAPEERVGQLVALRTVVSNGSDGYVDEALGLDVQIHNNNPDTEDIAISAAYGIRIGDIDQAESSYALHTGAGTVHLGDVLELPVFSSTPADNPPADYFKVYFKIESGSPRLFVKDSSGAEHEITGGEGGGNGGGTGSQDYVSIKATNRSGAASAVGQIGVLLRGEWYVVGEFTGLTYYRKRALNSELASNWWRSWDYLRFGVALEAVADGEALHLAVDGRVTVIGDGAIDAGELLKLSPANPGRLIDDVTEEDYPIGHAVTSCGGAGETFVVDLWTGGQRSSRGSFVVGDALLSKLGGPGLLG